MVKPLLDTSILIDFLNAVPEARDEMARYPDKAVSIVTWMEVVIGAPSALADATRNFLNGYEIVALDAPVAERAVELRRSHRIKLPDAVIWATAQIHGMLLVTRNTGNFPADDPGIRLPYQL